MTDFSERFDEGEGETFVEPPTPLKPDVPDPRDYPLDHMNPTAQAAVRAIVDKVQLPVALAAGSVLSAMALAVQGHVDVELPTGEIVPTSLHIFSVARSGERKSSSDKLAMKAIKYRETDLQRAYTSEQSSFLADHTAYKDAKAKAIKAAGSDRNKIRQAIEDAGTEPVAPPTPYLTVDEPTMVGLTKLMHEAWPSLGMFSDEGGSWVGGYSMKEEERGATGATLSKLWDGSPIKRVRGDGTIVLRGRRLSVHMMIQPLMAAKFFADPELKDQGLHSRLLICQPKSNIGERFRKPASEGSDAALRRYWAKGERLLTQPMPMVDPMSRELDPRVVKLSDEAAEAWWAFSDECERRQRPGAEWEEITGFASKLAQQAARIATVMAIFENNDTDVISARAMSGGIQLAMFYVSETLRLVGHSDADDETRFAMAVQKWLEAWDGDVMNQRYLTQFISPRELRSGPKIKHALSMLEEFGHIKPIKGKSEFKVPVSTLYPDGICRARSAFRIVRST